jgi:hypothetical protein
MAFDALTSAEIAAGKPASQTLFQKIKDCLDFLYGAAGASANSIQNGSFEIDSDADGVPDGGVQYTYPGGTFTYTAAYSMHGASSIAFTSPGGSGNGGGYWTFDYIEVGQAVPLAISWMHLSAPAGIHNLVEIFWYDGDKVALAGGNAMTVLYDSEDNPVTVTLASVSVTPPAGARFAKLRLTGAKSDNATAGYVYFDGVQLGFKRVNTVSGSASPVLITGDAPDRIHIDGSLASPSGDTLFSIVGTATGISGGRSVTVDYRTGSGSIASLSLTLPVGIWTIQAFGEHGVYAYIRALAIREI